MQTIKNVFVLIWRCSTSVRVYQDLANKSVWRGSCYLYFLLFLSASLWVLPLIGDTSALGQRAIPFTKSLTGELPNFFPPDLEIVVEHGELRANVAQPYYIPFPALLKELIDADPPEPGSRLSKAKHFIEIDTNAGIEDYLKRESVFLVTKHSLVMPDNKKEFEVKPIPRDESFVLNKAVFDSYLPKVLYYIEELPSFISIMGPVVLTGLWFLAPCVILTEYLCYLLVTSFVLKVVSVLIDSKLSYGRIFAISLYGLTPVIILQSLLQHYVTFPTFLFSAIFLGWMSAVLLTLARDSRAKQT